MLMKYIKLVIRDCLSFLGYQMDHFVKKSTFLDKNLRLDFKVKHEAINTDKWFSISNIEFYLDLNKRTKVSMYILKTYLLDFIS